MTSEVVSGLTGKMVSAGQVAQNSLIFRASLGKSYLPFGLDASVILECTAFLVNTRPSIMDSIAV